MARLSMYALRSLLRSLVRLRDLLARRAVDARLREAVILHVSSTNSCAVCSMVHGRRAARLGVSAESIAVARGPSPAGLGEPTATALRYAELRTLDREPSDPETVASFEQAFDPAQRAHLRAVIDLFTFTNRFNNTWEAWLPGARRRRQELGIGRPDDESTRAGG
jgi:AhpD family alkylhydroperoxidase